MATTNNCENNNTTTNNLRDIYNYLQPPQHANGYDHIIDMMRGLDLQDDGIVMNNKIKMIETDFCNIVQNENMLWESMEYMNNKALEDNETALKFALLFSSRNFDALAMNKVKVRTFMLTILEQNFLISNLLQKQDRERLYNSITLLGEYYHRVRLCDNTPIIILGEALIDMLIREVHHNELITMKKAKLLLSQITLNGDIMRQYHSSDMKHLFFHIRRNLIEQPSLTSAVKAMLLMAIDLYYSNFVNLGGELEKMYTKYLMLEHDDEEQQPNANDGQMANRSSCGSSNVNNNNSMHSETSTSPSSQQQQHTESQSQSQDPQSISTSNVSYENGGGECDGPLANASFESQEQQQHQLQPPAKKWSEQVYEDLYEQEFGNCDSGFNKTGDDTTISTQEPSQQQQQSQDFKNGTGHDGANSAAGSTRRNGRRPHHNKQPHTHHNNSNVSRSEDNQNTTGSSGAGGEELDESKPLPRWRATRFNRDNNNSSSNITESQKHARNHQQSQRRYSASFDDDGQSVRSEGGSIRLYSINDRLKHSQEKIERTSMGGSNAYNYIANSNWDRQSQRDDRSERSYISNYECGNYRRGGRRNHHWQLYDKPPRFQKQQQQQQHHNQQNNQQFEHKIHSESWRRSVYPDENTNSNRANGNIESPNSRSSSRARTLPRPAKSHWDNNSSAPSGGGGGASSYRRSQSPNMHNQQRQQRNYSSGGGGGGSARYSSQSSLASECSNTLERRRNQRNRSGAFGQQHRPNASSHKEWRTHEPNQENAAEQKPRNENDCQNANAVDAQDVANELVRNARQTTKYMNYLSAQK